jgi:CRISPR type III-A-associated protein Csm2
MATEYWNPSHGNLNKDWVTNRLNSDAIKWAERFGHHLADKYVRDNLGNRKQKLINGRKEDICVAHLTTSQLRRFFGEVRRIQNDLRLQKGEQLNIQDILLLKPRLAYQVGREKDKQGKIKDFYEQMSIAIDAVNSKSTFFNFIRLLEAIVAYHKELEPKKDN